MVALKPASYWKRLDDETPSFVIDGLIHSDATMITGRPKAGKTNLTAAMVSAIANGQPTFLGRKVNTHGTVVVVCTDPGEAKKWGRRAFNYGCVTRVFVASFADVEWDGFIPEVVAVAPALFVFDNILGATTGNSNQGEGASEVLPYLDRVIAKGIPTLALHHAGKDFMNYTPRGPMGHTKYAAWMRHNVDVLKSGDGTLSLAINGNESADVALSVGVTYNGDTLTASYEVLRAQAKEDKRPRGAATKRRRQGLFEEVAGNSTYTNAASKAEVGRLLHTSDPERWPSEQAARVAFDRAAKAVCGVYVNGKGWTLPEAA
ncbi:AAA family ATPase [Micromonospora sp. NPDC127501]|uniref:AAA family ATPase n=1 Tax=Micromonospora sp. NPDC127501 TaxID=3154872 RepID=UPI00331E8E53